MLRIERRRRAARRSRSLHDADLPCGVSGRPAHEPSAHRAACPGMARPSSWAATGGRRRGRVPAAAPLHGAHQRARGRARLDSVFAALGLRLDILPSGCCGMAGTWGTSGAPGDVGAHLQLELGGSRRGAGSSGLLADGYFVPLPGEAHRRHAAAPPGAGPPVSDPASGRNGGTARGPGSRHRDCWPSSDTCRRRSCADGNGVLRAVLKFVHGSPQRPQSRVQRCSGPIFFARSKQVFSSSRAASD